MKTKRKESASLIDCSGIKQVVFCRTIQGKPTPVKILDVIRKTPTQLVVGKNGKETDRLFKSERGLHTKSTVLDSVQTKPSEIKAAEKFLAQQTAEAEAYRKERLQLEADPHYQLVRRLRNADFEPYDKLTLEQLQQIAAWLDAVRE